MGVPRPPANLRRVAVAIVAVAIATAGAVVSQSAPAHASLGRAQLTLFAPGDLTYGQTAWLRADVEDVSTSCRGFLNCDRPTGSVAFVLNGAHVGTAPLTPPTDVNIGRNSEASLSVPNLPAGTYDFDGRYFGDFDPAFDFSAPRTFRVLPAPCSISLAVNRTVTVTETTPLVFTADLGPGGYGGSVDFRDSNGVLRHRATVTDGRTATFSIPYVWYLPDIFDLRAEYSGDRNHLPCQSAVVRHTLDRGETHTGEVWVPDPGDDNYVIQKDHTFIADILANDEFHGEIVVPRLINTDPQLAGFYGPQHGTVRLTDDLRVEYTPEPGYVGFDALQYQLVDAPPGLDLYGTATVSFAVRCIPTAVGDTFEVTSGTTLDRATPGLLANDIACDAEAAVASPPAHGSVTVGPDGALQYVPEAGFVGVDTFTYQLESDSASEPATVTLIVANESCETTLVDDTFTVLEGALDLPDPGVAGNDTLCGNVLSVDRPPSHGTLTLDPFGALTYQATNGYSGPDEFSYTIAETDTTETELATQAIDDPATATVRLTVVGPDTTSPTTSTTTTSSIPAPPAPPGPSPTPPPAPTPPPGPPVGELPATGSFSRPALLAAAAAVALGIVLVGSARRREVDAT